MGKKVKMKLIVEFETEFDTDWYDTDSVEEMIKIEEENAKNGELIELLLQEEEFTVKFEQI